MNRYRRGPGMGPPKASSTTTCQKCLQKGHYSYECKSSLQDRPYASRPSRTQQFSNPKLAPKLTSIKLDEEQGTAAAAAAATSASGSGNGLATSRNTHPSPPPPTEKANKRTHSRSRSLSSATSVSTISTNRSPSPRQASRSRSRSRSRSTSADRQGERGLKRRYNSYSSASAVSRSPEEASARHHRRSPSHRKNRRRRFDSPTDRGRPVPRRGSHRSPSRSPSLDDRRHRRSFASSTEDSNANGKPARPAWAKPRSPSPYSRRLALTQAMNMGA